jgi:hypothetical protein
LRNRVLVLVAAISVSACGSVRENAHPICEARPPTILMAEAVPTAQLVPCVGSLPVGWHFAGFTAKDGFATFSLDSDAGGEDALSVTFTRRCDGRAANADPVVEDEPRTVVTQVVRSEAPYDALRRFEFSGGCVVYEMRFASGAPVDRLVDEIARAVSFIDRARLENPVGTNDGLDPADV